LNDAPAERVQQEYEQFEYLHRMQDHAIQSARTSEPPDFNGAGIVIVAGGARCFTNAYVALTNLRNVVGCKLPIQLWFLGPDEMSPDMMRILRRFDVDPVDAFKVRRRFPVRRLGGWECKVYAILHSPFRHVVLLDADNVALIDPAMLFHLSEYTNDGAIFWPDNQSHPRHSPVWKLFRVPYRHELEVESGQLVIDKERCWIPLNLAQHFNEWSDIYFQYVYGDKETFHFAWRQLGQSYAMPAERPRIVYCHKETPRGRRRMTAALEQRDFANRVIFHHRTGAEWVLFGRNSSTDRADLEARCLAALADLRQQWNGRIAPDPPMADRVDGRNVAATRQFRYRKVGVDERLIECEPDGGIGLGAAVHEQTWRLEGEGNARRLVIAGQEGDTCRLKMGQDGVWRGSWLWYERMPVELIPVGKYDTGGQS
jgi:hypothetical protein